MRRKAYVSEVVKTKSIRFNYCKFCGKGMAASTSIFRYLQLGRIVTVTPLRIDRSGSVYTSDERWSIFQILIVTLQLTFDVVICCQFYFETKESAAVGEKHTIIVGGLVFLIWIVYYFTFRYVTCRRGPQFVNLLNEIHRMEEKMAAEFGASVESRTVFAAPVCVFTALSTFHIYNGICSLLGQTCTAEAQRMTIVVKKMFPSVLADFLKHNISARSLDIIGWFVYCYACLIDAYAFVLCLVLAGGMQVIAKSFIDSFRRNLNQPMTSEMKDKIIQTSTELFHLSEVMENAFGPYIFSFCFILLPFYSLQVIEAFNGTWATRVRVLFYVGSYSCSLIVAADANSLFKEFAMLYVNIPRSEATVKRALPGELANYNEQANIRVDCFRILLERVSKNAYGLKGLAFTITYGFVGNLCNLILTYAIIMIQFRPLNPQTELDVP